MTLTSPAARILVIDDNPQVVDLLGVCLRQEGYGVLGALTSDEGLKLAILSRPELVLLVIGLAATNGIEVLKRIRSTNPTTKVIMVTGNADPALARKALELGALAYIDKPFDLDYLKRVVSMVLQSRAESRDWPSERAAEVTCRLETELEDHLTAHNEAVVLPDF